jgi:hypothetical protein
MTNTKHTVSVVLAAATPISPKRILYYGRPKKHTLTIGASVLATPETGGIVLLLNLPTTL